MLESPPRTPKRILRALRELAGTAHQRELGSALRELSLQFDEWRQGRIDGFELTNRIHHFHQGPARLLYTRYSGTDAEFLVARALVEGIFAESEVPPEILPYIARHISFLHERRS